MSGKIIFNRYSLWSLLLVGMFLFSCVSRHKYEDKKIFRYNEASDIMTLDPAFARDQAHIWVCNQLYNGLVQLDENLEVQPSVAKSWEISKDGLTYVFHLRNDIFFHRDKVFGGKKRKVVAADFVFSFRRLADPATASPGAWVLSPVARADDQLAVSTPNDTTLIIELARPFPPFLSILSMPYCSVLPHEAVEFYKSEFRKHPVGTGPFYLKNWEENIKMVLRKNEDYFEKKNNVRLPLIDAVAITFVEDKMTAFLEFTKGNLDFLSGIYPSYKDELLSRKGELRKKYTEKFRMISVPYLNTEYLGILVDTSLPVVRENPLKELRLRQAVSYGFDREKMIRFLRNGIGIPGNKGIIPKGMPAFDEKASYGYVYDPDKSRELIRQLKEEGYPLEGVKLVTTSDYLDLCKFVQAQLDEVGLTIEIEVVPPAVAIELRAHSRVNFFRASWIADYPDEENYLSLFYSKNFAPDGPDYTHYANPVFDSLFEKAYLENDRLKRSRMYREMDSLVMTEAPVVILYYDEAVRFVNKRIKGMKVNPINLLELKTVEISD